MCNCIEKIKEYELLFFDKDYTYNGRGKDVFVIEEGTIPIMVSAPHAINHFRCGKIKKVDMYTGGITRYLHEKTGCSIIYACRFTESDFSFDSYETNKYKQSLKDFVETHGVKLLIDLHGANRSNEFAVEIETVPELNSINAEDYKEDPSLHQYVFIPKIVKDIFENNFRTCGVKQKEVWKNKVFNANNHETITKYISENTSTACMQLEINGVYRDPANEIEFKALVKSLKDLIDFLKDI